MDLAYASGGSVRKSHITRGTDRSWTGSLKVENSTGPLLLTASRKTNKSTRRKPLVVTYSSLISGVH